MRELYRDDVNIPFLDGGWDNTGVCKRSECALKICAFHFM